MNNTLHIHDVDIYYEEHGHGFPLILLHGNGEDCSIFNQQVARFSPHFRVIAIDSRGHGRSTRQLESLSYKDMANDVVVLLDHLKIEKCHITGFSDGGIIALYLSMRIPERIEKMVLIGTNYNPSGIKLSCRAGMFLSRLSCSIANLFGSSEKWKLKKLLYTLMLKEPHISEKQLEQINIDTLIIVGEHDMVKSNHTGRLHQLLNNSRIAVFDNADHFIPEKKPELLNEEIEKFLTASFTNCRISSSRGDQFTSFYNNNDNSLI
jgi:pimeloyl-ACP methyl ester carboxylesterase